MTSGSIPNDNAKLVSPDLSTPVNRAAMLWTFDLMCNTIRLSWHVKTKSHIYTGLSNWLVADRDWSNLPISRWPVLPPQPQPPPSERYFVGKTCARVCMVLALLIKILRWAQPSLHSCPLLLQLLTPPPSLHCWLLTVSQSTTSYATFDDT